MHDGRLHDLIIFIRSEHDIRRTGDQRVAIERSVSCLLLYRCQTLGVGLGHFDALTGETADQRVVVMDMPA